jgi:hypothetical protein
MAGQPQKRFGLDSTVLFDLAAEEDFAHTFREEFQRAGYTLLVAPTVVQELALKHQSKQVPESDLAYIALSCMREWDIRPFDLIPVGHGITEEFSRTLMSRGLLPDTEFNDGLILAETSLSNIPILVTSDRHLLDINDLVHCNIEV